MPNPDTPSYLPEVVQQWQSQLERLRLESDSAERNVTRLLTNQVGGRPPEPQLLQAQLEQLRAAQNYNAFLESGTQIIRVAQDAEARLSNTNLSLLERHQLETSRDQLYSLASAFVSFKTDRQLQVMHVAPVDSGGRRYYIDGRAEWNTQTAAGLLGQFVDGARDIAAGVREALTNGPFTSEQKLHTQQRAA